MHRKQGENETSADVWDRIKTCAAALESCGRIQSHLSLIDALKQNLGPAHVSWVNDLDDSYTLEDVDVAVYDKGMFVDHRENKGDSYLAERLIRPLIKRTLVISLSVNSLLVLRGLKIRSIS